MRKKVIVALTTNTLHLGGNNAANTEKIIFLLIYCAQDMMFSVINTAFTNCKYKNASNPKQSTLNRVTQVSRGH